MRRPRVHANIIALAAIAAAVLLYEFPPERYSFYPACPVFRYLHLYCPGCGSTRALAALLHGNLVEALQYNPLFVALLPFVLMFASVVYWSAVVKDKVEWPQVPKPAVTLLVAVLAVFAVVRNL